MNFLTAWISMKFKIDFDDILTLKSGADYSAPLFFAYIFMFCRYIIARLAASF